MFTGHVDERREEEDERDKSQDKRTFIVDVEGARAMPLDRGQ